MKEEEETGHGPSCRRAFQMSGMLAEAEPSTSYRVVAMDDASEDESKSLLLRNSLPAELAGMVVALVGGRLGHLQVEPQPLNRLCSLVPSTMLSYLPFRSPSIVVKGRCNRASQFCTSLCSSTLFQRCVQIKLLPASHMKGFCWA